MKGSPFGGANSAQKPPVPGNQRIWSSPPLDATATEFTPSAAAPAQNYTQTAAAPAQNYTQPSAAAPAQYYTQPAVPARRARLWPSGPRILPSPSYTEVFFPLPSAVPAHYMQPIDHNRHPLYVPRNPGPTHIGRPLETNADVERQMQARRDEMERRRAEGWVPPEFPRSFEDDEAQRLAASSTNVLHQPGTRPFQLNASAPPYVYAPTQTSAPPRLDATAPTSVAPIDPKQKAEREIANLNLEEIDSNQAEFYAFLRGIKCLSDEQIERFLLHHPTLLYFLKHNIQELLAVNPEIRLEYDWDPAFNLLINWYLQRYKCCINRQGNMGEPLKIRELRNGTWPCECQISRRLRESRSGPRGRRPGRRQLDHRLICSQVGRLGHGSTLGRWRNSKK